jgi:indole-3-glycerol phosphate synthase
VRVILDRILASKRDEVAARKRDCPERELRARARDLPPARALYAALRRPAGSSLRAVAEIKKASPSAGLLRADFDVAGLARRYAAGGAAALSVLTDGPFFQGHLAHLGTARAAVSLPLLRKDFLLEAYQLWEGRVAGADAALLIARAVPPDDLKRLLDAAAEAGLQALVEVHDEAEVERAVGAGAPCIGINNRDLHTFQTSLETTLRLRPRIPPDRLVVSESGLQTPQDVRRVAAAGVDAILVGEALLRAPDPGARLGELLGTPAASQG